MWVREHSDSNELNPVYVISRASESNNHVNPYSEGECRCIEVPRTASNGSHYDLDFWITDDSPDEIMSRTGSEIIISKTSDRFVQTDDLESVDGEIIIYDDWIE